MGDTAPCSHPGNTAGIEEVISLGGSFRGERHDYDERVVVVVMADSEGHLCLTQYF